jgi:hypothetical protein
MKPQFPLAALLGLILFSIGVVVLSCSAPMVKMPEKQPAIVKHYAELHLSGKSPYLKKSGIYLKEGDLYTVLATGKVNTNYKKYGKHGWEGPGVRMLVFAGRSLASTIWINNIFKSNVTGELGFVVRDGPFDYGRGKALNPNWYQSNRGGFDVAVIVWEKEDYAQIAEFLRLMHALNPTVSVLDDVALIAENHRKIQAAQSAANRQVDETREMISELKKQSTETGQSSAAVGPQNEKIAALEARLASLMQTLAQLDEMKAQLAAEKQKSDHLSQQLQQKTRKEKDLLNRISEAQKAPPIVVIAAPRDGERTEATAVMLNGVVEDDQGVQRIDFYLNNRPLHAENKRGIGVAEPSLQSRIDFNKRIVLDSGINHIKIRAVDRDGQSTEKVLTLHRIEKRRNVWAVIIGINAYPGAPPLKYAVNDARAFYRLLVKDNQVPAENVSLLLDENATLGRIRSTLGTSLKQKAGKDDMVIIYFAGHGATERDALSMDGDGLEKYILPYNARLDDLYGTALPMREIAHIFNRLRAERLIFIADSCYSGATGGRTVGMGGLRANISDAFLDRMAKGRGRVILTASGTNEVSAENDDLNHGVFTYYLLEGLKGGADTDRDGLISVDEAYRYVSAKVRLATGQEQNPLKKGTVEGSLILGIVR